MPPAEKDEIADIPMEMPLPEPAFTEIEKSEKSIPLKCNVIADYVRY